MSDTNVSQDRPSVIKTRVDKKIARDFTIALALRSETAQDVLYRAVVEYIQKTPLPTDTLLGKSE